MKFFRTYRKLTLPLVVLLLVAATGLTIDKHSCQGELKGISILGQAASCHQTTKSCHHQEAVVSCSNDISEKDCCHNEAQLVKLDSDLVEHQLETVIAPVVDIGFLATFLGLIYPISTESSFTHINYKPPLLNKNILVFIQSYLL